MSKYHNAKYKYNGIIFDSKAEMRRYLELLPLLRTGIISDLQRQVKFELVPSQKLPEPRKRLGRMERTERAVNYIADFVYRKGEKLIVEDVKGVATKDYIIKRKLMLWVHGIQIKEIKKGV